MFYIIKEQRKIKLIELRSKSELWLLKKKDIFFLSLESVTIYLHVHVITDCTCLKGEKIKIRKSHWLADLSETPVTDISVTDACHRAAQAAVNRK